MAKDYLQDEFKTLIRIYQSSCFLGKTPKEVEFFNNVVWTDMKDTILLSVEYMRNQMFKENETTIAVFIGGMKGIKDEYGLITKYYPDVKILPIATTGAASESLYKELGMNNPDLSDNYTFLFLENIYN